MRGGWRGLLATTVAAVSTAVPIAANVALAPPAAAAGQPADTPARTGVPANIYAIGDSITTSTGTAALGDEHPANSWVTGTNPSSFPDGRDDSPNVNSMRNRLGIAQANAVNLAHNGKRIQDFDDQATLLPSTAQYVVVELGGNDLCRPSVAEMTTTASFRTSLRAGLDAVQERSPNALIFIASIPDIYNLWNLRRGSLKARTFWDNPTGFVIPCESLLQNPGSNSAADENRRRQVRSRNIAFNQILAEECGAVLRCRYDGGGLFARSSNRVNPLDNDSAYLPEAQWWFRDQDISHDQGTWGFLCPANFSYSGCGDHFHPSHWGQAKLAQSGHELSYQFQADGTAPTATTAVSRPPDGGGVYASAVDVSFGGTDAAGVRGQEVRVQGPSDSAPGPWQQHLGLAPNGTISAAGTTYVQVRSLDVNGNLSASVTRAVTVDPSQFGAVGGTITGPSGPLSGIEVSLHAAGSEEAALAAVTTGADGSYAFPGLLAADDVKVRAHDPSGVHVDAWFDGAATHGSATAIDVPSAGTGTANLALGLTSGSITGVVSGPSGPVEGVVVTLTPGGATTTGAGGAYTVGDLAPGAYTVTTTAVPCAWLTATGSANVPTGGGADTVDLTLAEEPIAPHGMSDVPAWVDEPVRWLVDHCNVPPYMDGYPDQTFRPNDAITRAQVIRAIHRIAGTPAATAANTFPDVPTWVDDAVSWAVEHTYMTGYQDGTFRPNASITRAEVARLLFRLAGSPLQAPQGHGLSDVPAWVDDAVTWLVAEGHASGYPDQTFRPSNAITRAEFARMAHRVNT
jgi:lysophospholipase L1-like esterase